MSFSYEFMMPQKGSISSFRILYMEGQEYEFFFYILRYKKAKMFMTYLEYLELLWCQRNILLLIVNESKLS